jgi:ribonuclease VapC
MVIIGRGMPSAADALDALVRRRGIEIVPFDGALALGSRAAFIRFGKGRHPAGLNFGDCVSYALAQSRGLPLLFKGEDFAKTDVISALG